MSDTISYFWRNIGRLKILLFRNQSAVLRFTPSKEAIREGLARAQGRRKERGSEKGNT